MCWAANETRGVDHGWAMKVELEGGGWKRMTLEDNNLEGNPSSKKVRIEALTTLTTLTTYSTFTLSLIHI